MCLFSVSIYESHFHYHESELAFANSVKLCFPPKHRLQTRLLARNLVDQLLSADLACLV